jgi:transglutaminase-like putative cysteine protease
MKAATATDWLGHASLLRLLAVMLLVMAPHAPHLPPWISVGIVTLMLWRAAAGLRGWRLPGKLVRSLLTLAAFVSVYLTFGRATGQTVGTALLALMVALKLTEMSGRRDVVVVLYLLYFSLLTHFLRDQELWTLLWMLGCTVLITALLVDVNRQGGIPVRHALRLSLRAVAFALPIMAVLWVLFPRIPGPLWGVTVDSGRSMSGLSESMAPGDISRLIESDAVAFRVEFDGAPPPNSDMYWRGPVLWHFDGARWSMAPPRSQERTTPEVQLSGNPIDYRMMLEAHRMIYLFALDMPLAQGLPDGGGIGGHLNADYQAVTRRPVRERIAYRLRSYPEYRLQTQLSESERSAALQLESGTNPRTAELARQWRNEGLDDGQMIQRALRHFGEEGFSYTLEPPILGRDSVDAFLFETRRGFCEHYASSFAALMRAAGVPARVVLGYQGAEPNMIGDYYVVRQSNAHAWNEVWISGMGWIRVDPTAAVAPDRIEMNLEQALSRAGERLPSHMSGRAAVGLWVSVRWDWVNMQWNQWFLAYGPELQRDLMSRLGLHDWQRMIAALTALIMLAMGAVAWYALRSAANSRPTDAAAREWARILARLRRAGLPPLPGEGPRDYARRVAPALAESDRAALEEAAEAYLQSRYLRQPDAETLQRLRAARARLPLRPKRP